MPRKPRPSDMSPEEWQEYLRRFPRLSWWLGEVDGDHPNYPGMSQICQQTANSPSQDQPPLPPQRSFLASSTSPHPPLLSPPLPPFSLWAHQQMSLGASTSQNTTTSPSRCASTQGQSEVGQTASQASPPPSQRTCTFLIHFQTLTHPTVSSTSNNDAATNRPQMITVSIPLNTTIVGGLITRRELRIPSDLVFADFFSRVCANMDVKPEDASIGYKYHNDRARDPPRQLSDESEYAAMMTEMVRKVLAARSRNPVLLLHNLVCY